MLNTADQVNEAQGLTTDLAMWSSLATWTRAISVEWWGNNLVKIGRVLFVLLLFRNEPVKRGKLMQKRGDSSWTDVE